jgi:hypothetical protein
MQRQSVCTRKSIIYQESEANPEFSRLLCAAVVNPKFRKTLFSNPLRAVAQGYCGESFNFSEDEIKRLNSIRTNDLQEFAVQMLRTTESIQLPIAVPTGV